MGYFETMKLSMKTFDSAHRRGAGGGGVFFRRRTDSGDDGTGGGPAVSVVGATFRYGRGRSIALRDASLSIPRGAVTVLLGPNGAGKSTLLNGIAGLLPPCSGEVSLHVCAGCGGRRAAYVLQNTKVNDALPLTVREVVEMGRFRGPLTLRSSRDRAAVEEAMGRTGITHLSRRMFSHLSGGERQRALLAQGLAAQLDVLLLDEPAAGLDFDSEEAIREVVRQEREGGRTVVVASHCFDEAREADFVVLLAGRVVAAGSPGRVLTAENLGSVYRRRSAYMGATHLLEDGVEEASAAQ